MVNTCSFIDEAKEESIETILDLAAYKATAARKQLIVTGCLAQRYGQELREVLPEVDVFVGTGEFLRITQILEQKRRALEKRESSKKAGPRFLFWSQPVSGGFPRPAGPHRSAYPDHSFLLGLSQGCRGLQS